MSRSSSIPPHGAASASILPELEDAIARGTPARQAETLRSITQLFLGGAEHFTDQQVDLFDEVFGRLIEEIELRAQTELARALAPVDNAPTDIVRKLAHSPEISVAAPILRESSCLDESDLVVIARTQGQSHLMALAHRRRLDPAVTDLLVRRGDQDVVRKLAGNTEAKLSETGYAALVKRARLDSELAERVGRRGDIPPTLFRRLVSQATAVVQQRLFVAADPTRREVIRNVMARLADEAGAAPPRDYAAAQDDVARRHREGGLTEALVAEFARSGRFEHVVAALSAKCEVSIEVVDRLITGDKPDPILILCKAMRFSRATVAAVLSLRLAAGSGALQSALDHFDRLGADTARRVVRFWQAAPQFGATGA